MASARAYTISIFLCYTVTLDSDSDSDLDPLTEILNKVVKKSNSEPSLSISSSSGSDGSAAEKEAADDEKISTSEAVQMIRDMLKKASKRSTEEDGAQEREADDSKSETTEDKLPTARATSSGLTVTMHEESGANASISDGSADSVDSNKDGEVTPMPHPTHPEPEMETFTPGAAILPPKLNINSALKKVALVGGPAPEPASRKTAEGFTCNLKPHRYLICSACWQCFTHIFFLRKKTSVHS